MTQSDSRLTERWRHSHYSDTLNKTSAPLRQCKCYYNVDFYRTFSTEILYCLCESYIRSLSLLQMIDSLSFGLYVSAWEQLEALMDFKTFWRWRDEQTEKKERECECADREMEQRKMFVIQTNSDLQIILFAVVCMTEVCRNVSL